MSKFQLVVISILVFSAVIAFLMFAGIIPGFGNKSGEIEAEITMWGPFSDTSLRDFFTGFNDENRGAVTIKYFEKNPETYKTELINAMASGNPPDLWFMTQDMIWEFKDKVQAVPFDSFPERNFKDTFADVGEIFLDKNNSTIIAFPYLIDPLVLYWNKDIFSSSGIAKPPSSWEEFLSVSTVITKFDGAGNIARSGAALGEYRNIKNAKEILSMMILQAGNPISQIAERGNLEIVWGEKNNTTLSPAENSLRFFNEFSNSSKTSYSWNRSMGQSDSVFSAGSLAMYFGFAGELEAMKRKNPHLNLDISAVPQIKDGPVNATFGRVYALAVSKTSVNKQAAIAAIYKITGSVLNAGFAESIGLAPARRDALAQGNTNPFLSVFYKSAVMARSWLEPNPQFVSTVFQNMIESTATGKIRISEAISSAKRQIEELAK